MLLIHADIYSRVVCCSGEPSHASQGSSIVTVGFRLSFWSECICRREEHATTVIVEEAWSSFGASVCFFYSEFSLLQWPSLLNQNGINTPPPRFVPAKRKNGTMVINAADPKLWYWVFPYMIINPEFLDMYLYFLERSKNPRPGRETLGDLVEDRGSKLAFPRLLFEVRETPAWWPGTLVTRDISREFFFSGEETPRFESYLTLREGVNFYYHPHSHLHLTTFYLSARRDPSPPNLC